MKNITFNWKILISIMILAMCTSFIVSTSFGIGFSILCIFSILHWINKYNEEKHKFKNTFK
jgi:hypothetical protein